MATSVLLKFLTLKKNISRTIWRIEVGDGSLFCIFHALSFELNFFSDRRFPLISLGGQKENTSNKENSTATRNFMNERPLLKLIKIFDPNLLKFYCQNLPFRRSVASSKPSPFLCPQELKFIPKSKTMRLGVILHVCVLGRKGESKRDTA